MRASPNGLDADGGVAMDGGGSGEGKVFGRFSEPAHRVLDLAPEEAERVCSLIT
jgi:hypothetical protein